MKFKNHVVFSASLLALTGACAFTSSALAQTQKPAPAPARIQPPDMLSEDEATEDEAFDAEAPPTSMQPPEIEPLESDAEPVPIIKKSTKQVDAGGSQGSRYIEHPNAKKGLIKIDKDKIYHYKVQGSEQKGAGSLKVAVYEPTNLENPEDPGYLNYDTIYDDGATPLFLYEHEWQIWQKFGKFGLTVSGGFLFAEGHGKFASTSTAAEDPKEQFMLLVFPVHAGGVLRLQFSDTQRFVPYGGGGIGGMAFAERRDDDLNPRLGARLGFSPNVVAYGGVAVQLGSSSRSFLDLDREYGINKMYLTAEYRTYIHLGGDYDFSGDAINGGITAEF